MPEITGTRFGQIARKYHNLRPTTPDAAMDWLTAGAADIVVELGAGNGMMTERLLRRRLRVHAIEPDPRMRLVLGQRCPGAIVLDGSAEHIPHDDSSVNAVFVGNAWHWFDPQRATNEIARVLRIGGTLGVMWNMRDESEPWVLELDRIMGWRPMNPKPGHFALPPGAPFTTVAEFVVAWTWSISPEELLESGTSYSYVLAQSEEERSARLLDARRFVDSHPGLAGRSIVDVPIRSVCYRTVRVRSGSSVSG